MTDSLQSKIAEAKGKQKAYLLGYQDAKRVSLAKEVRDAFMSVHQAADVHITNDEAIAAYEAWRFTDEDIQK